MKDALRSTIPFVDLVESLTASRKHRDLTEDEIACRAINKLIAKGEPVKSGVQVIGLEGFSVRMTVRVLSLTDMRTNDVKEAQRAD